MTVKQIQCLLEYLGYSPGAIDGIDGAKTQSALAKFKAEYGMGSEGLVAAVAGTAAKLNNVASTNTETGNNVAESTGTFWDGIKYFKRSEFVCKCGGKYCGGNSAEMEEKLIKVADRVREHFGNPVTVTSGVRCKQHNANVGGVSNSRHLSGKAMDFSVSGFSASSVLSYVQAQTEIRYAYAIDINHVHMDVL